MQVARSRQQCRQGAATVEFAVCLPLLLVLILGLWDVARMVEVQNLLTNAAREGGRAAAAGDQTAAQCQQVVVNYLTNNGVAVTSSNVTVTNLTSGKDPTLAAPMDQLQVSVSIPFDQVRWSLVGLIASGTTMNATTTWYSLNDTPITVNTAIPPG